MNKETRGIINNIPCSKSQYASEEEANRELRKIRNSGKKSSGHKLPVRAYQCNTCPFWHLTSKK